MTRDNSLDINIIKSLSVSLFEKKPVTIFWKNQNHTPVNCYVTSMGVGVVYLKWSIFFDGIEAGSGSIGVNYDRIREVIVHSSEFRV